MAMISGRILWAKKSICTVPCKMLSVHLYNHALPSFVISFLMLMNSMTMASGLRTPYTFGISQYCIGMRLWKARILENRYYYCLISGSPHRWLQKSKQRSQKFWEKELERGKKRKSFDQLCKTWIAIFSKIFRNWNGIGCSENGGKNEVSPLQTNGSERGWAIASCTIVQIPVEIW